MLLIFEKSSNLECRFRQYTLSFFDLENEPQFSLYVGRLIGQREKLVRPLRGSCLGGA